VSEILVPVQLASGQIVEVAATEELADEFAGVVPQADEFVAAGGALPAGV
jgi:hypothetical protein